MEKSNNDYFFGMTEQEIKIYEEDMKRIEQEQVEQNAKDQAVLEKVEEQVSKDVFKEIEFEMKESEHYSNFRIINEPTGTQKWVQRDKVAPDFNRGGELSLCNHNTYPRKTVVETGFLGIGKE